MAAPASFPRTITILSTWCLLLALVLFADRAQAAPKWKPVDPAELADNKPHVDPDAGAEIILQDVSLDHSSWYGADNTTYVRIKIYNQRGVDKFSIVELPYDEHSKLSYIFARTIKPDGTTVELDPKDIYDREIIKADNIRRKVKAFAPPGLEPGAIVEYRYTEITDEATMSVQMFFQSKIPARLVRFRLKLLKIANYDVCALSFNCPAQPLKLSPEGECSFEMANQKAASEEPFQPPAINTLSTILVYRKWAASTDVTSEYWGEFSKKWYREVDFRAKPNKAITTALAGIVAPSDSDDEKLRKIYDFCRTKIISRYSDASNLTGRQVSKLKENETAADVLKAGNASHDDFSLLFAALVRAAGLDAGFAQCNDRTHVNYNPKLITGLFMMEDLVVRVRTMGGWRYFDPGTLYLPFGTLSWHNCDTMILHCDDSGKAEPMPLAGPAAEASQVSRKADLKLDSEGVLEGNVTEDYTGYQDVTFKNILDDKTATERETFVREQVQEKLKLAEVSAIVVENAASPTEPLKISYHLRIPAYADRTGTRLFLQPAIFQKGAPSWFEAETRQTTIMFPYRYTTNDEIHITPPEGYTLEEASSPGGVDMGPVGEYNLSLAVGRETGTLSYKRTFKLTGLTFAKKSYKPIKAMFDEIYTKDGHTVILKRIEPEPTAIGESLTPPVRIEEAPAKKE
jgi:hypothetical protein